MLKAYAFNKSVYLKVDGYDLCVRSGHLLMQLKHVSPDVRFVLQTERASDNTLGVGDCFYHKGILHMHAKRFGDSVAVNLKTGKLVSLPERVLKVRAKLVLL